MNVYESKGQRIFEIVHWPFELQPNQHRPTGPFGWQKWCSLARPSKGQCTISKILLPLILYTFIEQNTFFPETCFAYTISEPKFMCVFFGLIIPESLKFGNFSSRMRDCISYAPYFLLKVRNLIKKSVEVQKHPHNLQSQLISFSNPNNLHTPLNSFHIFVTSTLHSFKSNILNHQAECGGVFSYFDNLFER